MDGHTLCVFFKFFSDDHATQPPGQMSVNQSTTLLSLHRDVSIGLITCTQPLFIECPEQSALVHLRSCWRYDRDVSNQKILPNFQGRLAMFTEENSTLKCNVNVMKSNLNILKRKIILRSVYTRTLEMGCNEINRFVYTRRDIAGHHNDAPPENGSCTHFIAPAGWYHPKSYNQTIRSWRYRQGNSLQELWSHGDIVPKCANILAIFDVPTPCSDVCQLSLSPWASC